MSEGGRARGRGVARGQQPQQPQHSTGRSITRTPAPPRGSGDTGPPPGFKKPPQQQQPSGRAAHRGASAAESTAGIESKLGSLALQGSGGGNGGNGSQVRGGLRGRRAISGHSESFITKPATCDDKKGISGKPLMLCANYFKLNTQPNVTLYQFRVDMAPEEDRTIVRRALLNVHKKRIGNGFIFDGTMLFTFNRLSTDESQPLELFSERSSDKAKIQITIKFIQEVSKGDYLYLQIYNIVIRKCLSQLNLTQLDRNYYDKEARIVLRDLNLELWPGYITSIRQHDDGILLCSVIKNKILRNDTAYDMLEKVTRENPSNYQRAYQADVVGQIVLTTYGNTKTYRVDDVAFDATPMSTFDMKGAQVTYVDYYRKKYGVAIRNTKQPMLVSMPKARDRRAGQENPIYLVPELCKMTGLTDDMRADQNLMRKFADETRLDPLARQQKLLAFNQRFNNVQAIKEELANWNLSLDRKLVEVKARQLPDERIIQGSGVSYEAKNVDWNANLRSNPSFVNEKLDSWAVITPRKCSQDTQQFVQLIIKAGRGMNFNVVNPIVEEINDDRTPSFLDSLERLLSKSKPKLVMCIVPNNRADRYTAIKKKTYVDRAVPSQVLCARTMTRKGNFSIATKVAIQLNCKIGGAPWTVDFPLQGLMVVGYDVCHDNQKKELSYGAMVASLNKPLSRYFSTVSAHTSGEEVFKDLPINIGMAIKTYCQHNGALPSRIAIYRDGVGDGQIPQVKEHEVEAILKALQAIYKNQPVKLCFIIVTKRINLKLFYGQGNPPPGTVVDQVVTQPERYDFYLVSQSVRQGSVAPTGYNIIYDTIGLDPDKIQRLTYKLTHLYYNWSGTVRVPAPCQYAHKLAYLVGQNLHRPPNPELNNLLYFL